MNETAPHHLDLTGTDAAPGRGRGGPAPVRITVAFGFWIFLLSDIIMFAAVFAAYAVLSGQTAGGPGPGELFDLRIAGIETVCLLLSSYTCGLAALALEARRPGLFYAFVSATFLLGGAFLALELSEFAGLLEQGAVPSRSAFLSAFFALVGLHGAHVTVGLIWLTLTTAQIAVQGRREALLRRFHCFTLFWHALDIVWVAVLTQVYLTGEML